MISYFFHVYICTDVYVFVCVQTHMCAHVHVCKHVCRGPALKLDVFLGSSPRYPTLQSFSLMRSLVSWLLWLANLFWGSHLHLMSPEITCGHHTYMSPDSGDTDSDPCAFAASTFLTEISPSFYIPYQLSAGSDTCEKFHEKCIYPSPWISRHLIFVMKYFTMPIECISVSETKWVVCMCVWLCVCVYICVCVHAYTIQI